MTPEEFEETCIGLLRELKFIHDCGARLEYIRNIILFIIRSAEAIRGVKRFNNFRNTVRWKMCKLRAKGFHPLLAQLTTNALNKKILCEYRLPTSVLTNSNIDTYMDGYCSRVFTGPQDKSFTVCRMHHHKINSIRNVLEIDFQMPEEICELCLAFLFSIPISTMQRDYWTEIERSLNAIPFLQNRLDVL